MPAAAISACHGLASSRRVLRTDFLRLSEQNLWHPSAESAAKLDAWARRKRTWPSIRTSGTDLRRPTCSWGFSSYRSAASAFASCESLRRCWESNRARQSRCGVGSGSPSFAFLLHSSQTISHCLQHGLLGPGRQKSSHFTPQQMTSTFFSSQTSRQTFWHESWQPQQRTANFSRDGGRTARSAGSRQREQQHGEQRF